MNAIPGLIFIVCLTVAGLGLALSLQDNNTLLILSSIVIFSVIIILGITKLQENMEKKIES